MAKKSKTEMLETLRGLLREALRLRREGAVYARLAHAGGEVDGYMRAILDAGFCDTRELLAVVAAERAAADGPATGTLGPEATSILAA